MPSMRLTTVQFAIPDDDPAFRLAELRDMLQVKLYDEEGMSGSFQIIGTAEFDDPDDTEEGCSRSCDWFSVEPFDLLAIKNNAKDVLSQEVLGEAPDNNEPCFEYNERIFTGGTDCVEWEFSCGPFTIANLYYWPVSRKLEGEFRFRSSEDDCYDYVVPMGRQEAVNFVNLLPAGERAVIGVI